ncbi:glycosyltransferase family 9 protein [Desulfonatronovibrio hydrogenovorans]|uniref:glycosyltransferase family 9 protein n=1 Tax=Desulfonatronovibrio hydrogenovorans TaxID=53245 RepID=UPI00048C6393|nr:glycosyltransferase family 9 protein [Desulfonatronovibrio hydrogenovorans]
MAESCVIVRLGSLGDVLLTTGVLAFAGKEQGLMFHVVTRSCFGDIFLNHPAVQEVIPVNLEDLTWQGWQKFCSSLVRTHPGKDLVDLHVNLRTFFLKRIWQGQVKTYPKFSLSRRFFALTGLDVFKNRLVSLNIPQRYAISMNQEAPDKASLIPRIFLSPEEQKEAATTLSFLEPGNPLVCLHPYATHQAKTWPRSRWQELTVLLEKNNLDWIVIGQDPNPLFPDHPRDLTNKTSIRQTGAVIARCVCLVTGDSGPMHLATAVDTPVVALFGPTSREWGFFPSGSRDLVLEADLKCRPCSLHGQVMGQCRNRCMELLEPQQVVQACLINGMDSNKQVS